MTSAASENAKVQSIRLVIFGRQGAGKGTQCARLSEHYQITHVSTGDMLRGAADAGTPFGLQAKEIMDLGELVPDDVMIGLVNERLHEDDCSHGFLLDGFPRTLDQVDALDELLAPASVQLALNLDVPEDVVMERMLARGREDDTPDAIRKRLELYEAQTAPLLHWYSDRDLALRIDGVGTEDEVAQRLVSAIDSFLQLENS